MTAAVAPTVTEFQLSADLSELVVRSSEDHELLFSAENRSS